MVRISVGGRVIAGSLVLTNAGQSFTVDISDTFTTVTVVALNEGTQPPNTAGIRVSAGGRDLKASSWSLKTNTVGSTVIRRGGAP
ncbi:MAG: hypothetical protein HY293_13735 [Planctomycetes bacterium]|nr:hypothetical protein [Planctomycetota bacterium]